mmetsp:Transcript_44996/g.82216  ORF Transcript_44996/g.82216 Transcript_44996/m.82216 type:complete len:112 (-) Transcript_44996:23-358(-)
MHTAFALGGHNYQTVEAQWCQPTYRHTKSEEISCVCRCGSRCAAAREAHECGRLSNSRVHVPAAWSVGACQLLLMNMPDVIQNPDGSHSLHGPSSGAEPGAIAYTMYPSCM